MPSLLSELVAVLAPPACAGCREPLPRADALVCGSCLAAIPWARGWRCPRCGLAGHGGRRCPAHDSAFDCAWSPVTYAGAAKALVGALKFHAALGVADLLGAQVAANLPPGFRGLPVVPVPPHRGRRLDRRGHQRAGGKRQFASPHVLPQVALHKRV